MPTFTDLPRQISQWGLKTASDRLVHPARAVPLGFALAIAIGTAALMLPGMRVGGEGAPFLTALFTAVSAVCVTGLVTVDTGTYWSGTGQGAILLMIQIGGLGTLVVTTLLLLAVRDKLSIGNRLLAQADNRGIAFGRPQDGLRTIIKFTLAVEIAIAMIVTGWLWLAYDAPLPTALWDGVFHAVSAFNNAGFGLRSDSLVGYANDPVILMSLSAAVILGGIGLPVVREFLGQRAHPMCWSMHTKLTLLGAGLLTLLGLVLTMVIEWRPGGALGAMDATKATLNALTHSVMLRTAGFNSFDLAALDDASIVLACFLMVIGGGSLGTAGGIKITTFMVLALVVWAELRGTQDSSAFGRRLPGAVQRQALAIMFLAATAIGLGTMGILLTTDFALRDVVFEVTSAFATVGLTTGITAQMPPSAQLILIILMFIGRVGPISLGAALVLRTRPQSFQYPEERPIIG